MELSASFGEWVRRRRKALDLTQEALAERVGCSPSAIRKIESDERRPSRQVSELLATALAIAPKDQPRFLQVARRERSTDLLAAIAAVDLAVAPAVVQPSTPAISPPIPPQAGDRGEWPLAKAKGEWPQPCTPLLGRQRELQQIGQLLEDPHCRLLTITGPGGIGKTRLAVAAAAQAADKLRDGIYFVPLASISATEFIAPAIATALSISIQGTGQPMTQIIHHLRNKQLLLLLDNLEHLLTDTDWLVTLLEQTPTVKLLTTSRERLNLLGEWVFDLQGLPAPPVSENEQIDSEEIKQYSAVALFIQRAQQTHVQFMPTPADYAAIVQICRLLEGMPLAIELAAAWVRVFACQEIAEELTRNLGFLETVMRDVPMRHRSLRAAFDHSWRLLTPEEQAILSRVAIFRGGFQRPAAAQVAQAGLPQLAALVDKSLLRRTTNDRYELHELIRQFAELQLAAMDTQAVGATKLAHARHYLEMAELAQKEWHGPKQLAWLDRLQHEHDNLRAALAWTLAAGELAISLRLAGALWRFWWARGHVSEGRRWLAAMLAEATPEKIARQPNATELTSARARALHIAGSLARIQGDFAQAESLHNESLALRRALGNIRGVSASLMGLGNLALFRGDYAAAEAYFTESLALDRQLGDERSAIGVISNLGIVAMYQGDYALALQRYTEALTYHRQQGEQRGVAGALGNLGDVYRYQGEYAQAQAVLEESLALLRQLNDTQSMAITLNSLGRVALGQNDIAGATAHFKESLKLYHAIGDKVALPDDLEGLARVAAHQQQWRYAIALYGTAAALRTALGAPLAPPDRQEHETCQSLLRSEVGERTFATFWSDGNIMSLEQAVTYALAYSPMLPV